MCGWTVLVPVFLKCSHCVQLEHNMAEMQASTSSAGTSDMAPPISESQKQTTAEKKVLQMIGNRVVIKFFIPWGLIPFKSTCWNWWFPQNSNSKDIVWKIIVLGEDQVTGLVQSSHPDSSDRLCRSHILQYRGGYYKSQYRWGYSDATVTEGRGATA